MPSLALDIRTCVFLLAAGLSLTAAGCARNSTHAASPTAAPIAGDVASSRPMTTAPDTDATPPVETAVTPPVISGPESQPQAAIPAAKPPAPRKPAAEQAPTDAASEPARPTAPLISPQLSASDQAAYQRRTGLDASAAEKNLQAAAGRQLSASQQDLVEKIRSFLSDSRDASKDGDWARAQTLAQKARLLSAELIASF